MGCNALFAAVPPAIRPDAKIETRIEKILGRLTLEEKIGQMCQLTVSMVTDMNDSGHPFISDELLDTVIGHYKVGSILNVPFDEAQSREAWTQIIGRIQRRSLDCLGIPCIYGVDQMHGASYTRGATFFPQGINMGAALNCELMRRSSEISACLCHSVEFCAGDGFGTRSPMVEDVGELRRGCLCQFPVGGGFRARFAGR